MVRGRTMNSTANPDQITRPGIRRLLLIGIPALFLVLGLIIYLSGGRYATTENAYTKADVLSIRPRVAGTVVERLVMENEAVKAGQLLLVLDPKPYEVALAKAEAKLGEVRTNLAALQASYRERQSELQLAKANRDYAVREQERQATLAERKLVSKDRKSTRLNSSDVKISYAVFCLKKKKNEEK